MISETVQAASNPVAVAQANGDLTPSRKISKPNSPVRRTVAADPLYDVYEVADYLGVDHTTVRSYIERGSLAATRPGGKLLRVSLSAIKAFLNPSEDSIDHAQAPKSKRQYVRPTRPDEPVLSLSEAWDRRKAAKGGRR